MPSNIVQVAFLVSINVSLRRSGQLLSYRLPVDSGIGSHAALSSFFLVVFSVFLFLEVFLFFSRRRAVDVVWKTLLFQFSDLFEASPRPLTGPSPHESVLQPDEVNVYLGGNSERCKWQTFTEIFSERVCVIS